jgi:hypothetical protein
MLSPLDPNNLIHISNCRSNRLTFQRQLEGIFKIPNLQILNLAGNPVCNSLNYRQFVISNCPKLIRLDGVYANSFLDVSVFFSSDFVIIFIYLERLFMMRDKDLRPRQ